MGSAAAGVIDDVVPLQIPDFSQRDVLAVIDELIGEVGSGASEEWENPWLGRYLEAMWAWLDGQPEPPRHSMERRMIGHILSPPGDFTSLADYFAAVKLRVQAPGEGWPSYLEMPPPAWGVIGAALQAACIYE